LIDVNSLLSVGCHSRIAVGIGLQEAQLSLAQQKLSSLGCKVRLKRFSDSHEMARSLLDGDIDAAVRGTLGSSRTLQELKASFGVREIMRTAVLEDADGKQFLLTPVGIDEGMDRISRTALALASIAYFSSSGWTIRCGVLSKGRTEDSVRGSDIRASIEDGDRIVASLRAKGHAAEHYAILIEEAVRDSDMVIAPDGVSGNLIFRTLHFLGGCKAYGAPVVNISKVFVDTSRSKSSFSDSVLLAAGLVEKRRSAASRS
jgi:putative methanogen marker protein 4